MLAIARAVDVQPNAVHGKPIEDGAGDGSVAEVLSPVAELDVGGDSGRGAAVSTVDEVEQGVGGGGLVVALADLAEADVVDDDQVGSCPRAKPTWIGVVGEACMQVVQEIDATGVADANALLAGTQRKGLEEVAFAGAGLSGDDQIVTALDEAQATELEDEALVDGRLEVEVEGFEGFALVQTAVVDAPLDAALGLGGDLAAQDMLEEDGMGGALAKRPVEQLVEVGQDMGQSEELQVPSESDEDLVGVEVELASGSGSWLGAVGGTFSHGAGSCA